MTAKILQFPLRVHQIHDFSGKIVSIRMAEIVEINGTTEKFHKDFGLYFNSHFVASCRHPKPLSRYAFEHGAGEVRHEYDCKIAEEIEQRAYDNIQPLGDS